MQRLDSALNQGLDAGLTLSEAKEILVQLYAYAGFPRSWNALDELLKVVDARRQRGVQDAPGREPRPVPVGKDLLALGTANQTKLSGGPIKEPLFEFAPAIDEYLKTHLLGDIFARDNLDWQSRELATVGALAAMPGVEPQLQSHINCAARRMRSRRAAISRLRSDSERSFDWRSAQIESRAPPDIFRPRCSEPGMGRRSAHLTA